MNLIMIEALISTLLKVIDEVLTVYNDIEGDNQNDPVAVLCNELKIAATEWKNKVTETRENGK